MYYSLISGLKQRSGLKCYLLFYIFYNGGFLVMNININLNLISGHDLSPQRPLIERESDPIKCHCH